MAAQCTLTVKLKDAGLGEKPKVFLDNKEVGKVSISKELSLTVSVGKHRLRLHGLSGGGRTAEIDIQATDAAKYCVFTIDMLSLKERYYLADTYSESGGPVSRALQPASAVPQAEGAVYPTERKSKKGLAVFFVIAIVVAVLVCVNYFGGAANKLDGTYVDSQISWLPGYLIFSNDGTVKQATLSSDGERLIVFGTGTYKLDGETLIVYMNDMRSETATERYTYNKSTDTITSIYGVVYKRQK